MKLYLINNNIEKIIKIINEKNYVLNNNLYIKLENTKKKIDEYSDKWEEYKKILNDYEYIYYNTNINNNICKYNKSISRAFYKLHEILHEFYIINNNNNNITCIAEGPGGFIQSFLYNFKNINNINGITLKSSDSKIPDWHYFIKNYKKVQLLYGINKNGDICNMDNIRSIINEIGINSQDIITCDGGIDYSNDYNSQEILSYDLIYSEIILSLHIQKENGTLILKIFDIGYYKTLQLIYILYMCYDNIYIYKPSTSRKSNSEKYLICKKYKKNDKVINIMKYYFNDKKGLLIYVPDIFKNIIIRYNNIMMNNQIKTIDYIILNILKNNYNIYPTKLQIKKCIDWCNKYKLPINKKCNYI